MLVNCFVRRQFLVDEMNVYSSNPVENNLCLPLFLHPYPVSDDISIFSLLSVLKFFPNLVGTLRRILAYLERRKIFWRQLIYADI